MNKIATYLNEHLAGEVITHDSVLRQAETDGSILARRPDMVVRAADMNDIRFHRALLRLAFPRA